MGLSRSRRGKPKTAIDTRADESRRPHENHSLHDAGSILSPADYRLPVALLT